MVTKFNSPFHYFCLLLMAAAAVVRTTTGDSGSPENFQVEEALEACQTNAMSAWKKIFSDEQNCPPWRQKCEAGMKRKLAHAEAKMERKTKVLIAAALAPPSKRKSARVPKPKVYGLVNATHRFSCEPNNGSPLSSCLWSRTTNGGREDIILDEVVAQAGGSIKLDGVLYGLQQGRCSVRILSPMQSHLGTWSCILIGTNGDVFNGQVEVELSPKPTIHFATFDGHLKAYSGETSETTTIASDSGSLYGITYDFQRDVVYWSSASNIYRKPSNGSQVTTVLSTEQYGDFEALDFDWITTNLYVRTWSGHILACGTRAASSLNCVSLLSSRGRGRGIAIDPNQGLLFWTSYSFKSGIGSVGRADMDGSNPSTIVTGLNTGYGIAVDVGTSRLYWTVTSDSKVQSSDLHGRDIQTVLQFPSGSALYGIALFAGRIYITDQGTYSLQSFTTAGDDLRVVHTGTKGLSHLAVVASRSDLPTNRANDCEGQRCSNVCVLTPTSFRCVP